MEMEYKATPPAEELDSLGQAGKELASAPKSVSVRLSETSVRPTLVLEFTMKTQAQYKVIGEIWETVQFYMSELYSDMSVSFPKQPKRSRARSLAMQ